jgi:hypothetical protein
MAVSAPQNQPLISKAYTEIFALLILNIGSDPFEQSLQAVRLTGHQRFNLDPIGVHPGASLVLTISLLARQVQEPLAYVVSYNGLCCLS